MGRIGDVEVTHTATGLARYRIEIAHHELNRFEVVRADSAIVALKKARARVASWDDQ